MANPRPKKVSFLTFLKKFPPVELPVTLGVDAHLDFSRLNPPLDPLEIEDYLLPLESEPDEFTEFIPCFCLPDTDQFIAIVYWKTGLLDAHYRLVTYDKRGQVVSDEVIAGQVSDGNMLARSVATIDASRTVYIVSGQGPVDATSYDPKDSTTKELEIFDNGQIGVMDT